MKNFDILFSVTCFVFSTLAFCPGDVGCQCFTDKDCTYYCSGNTCQPVVPYGNRCSGNALHPKECGSNSFCDPSYGYTCRYQKSSGESCTYSYSCVSNYCDYSTRTCRWGPETYYGWAVPTIATVIFITVLVTVLLVIIRVRRQRRLAMGCYQNPYVVVPGTAYQSYQHQYPVVENAPPPYPGPMRTYQS